MVKPFMPDNCPIAQHTADGHPTGRCWHYLILEKGKYNCPLHGDVSAARKLYVEEGKVTDDQTLDRK